MVLLRCAKCGSHEGFLIETSDRKILEVNGQLSMDRIKKSVLVTCTYCNNRWDHVPVILTEKNMEDVLQQKQDKRLLA